jgi:hypothetical protein
MSCKAWIQCILGTIETHRKNFTYLSRVGSLMRSITNPRTLKVVNLKFQDGEDYQTTLP